MLTHARIQPRSAHGHRSLTRTLAACSSGYSPTQLTRFRESRVGFVFQSVNVVPFLTARRNLLVVDELGRRTGSVARASR